MRTQKVKIGERSLKVTDRFLMSPDDGIPFLKLRRN
jgi:hypothetical protein